MRGDCNKNMLDSQLDDFMVSRRGVEQQHVQNRVKKEASREISQSRLGSFVKGLFG